jgi:hypothetical protein
MQMLAENAEYEMTIEDMARVNGNLDAELELVNREKEALEEDLVTMQDNFNSQTEQIANMIAALSSPTTTVVLSDTGTIVDAQFSKARTFISQLEAEISAVKKVGSHCLRSLAPRPSPTRNTHNHTHTHTRTHTYVFSHATHTLRPTRTSALGSPTLRVL